jgi:hypothetical protein
MTENKNINNIFNFPKEQTKIEKKCTHYNNNLLVYADCCKKYYDCHLCHNEEEGHVMDRSYINKIKCSNCNIETSPSKNCKNCNIDFGKYHCSLCKIWCNNNKDFYHCYKCGNCKIGNINNYYHCDTCNLCFLKLTRHKHVCLKFNKDENCSICLNKIFINNQNPIIILNKCKHLIHKNCLQELKKSCVDKIPGCMLCKKSVVNYKLYETKYDNFIRDNQLPEYYDKWTTDILCNDCTKKCNVKYHFKYHKCTLCKSYNTSVLNINRIN